MIYCQVRAGRSPTVQRTIYSTVPLRSSRDRLLFVIRIGMKMIQRILSLFTSNSSDDMDNRVKCSQCRNRVLANIAASNGGLCGVCHRRKHPKPERDTTKPSPYQQLLDTPSDQLDDGQNETSYRERSRGRTKKESINCSLATQASSPNAQNTVVRHGLAKQ